MLLKHLCIVRFKYITIICCILIISSCGNKQSWLSQRNREFYGGNIEVPESKLSIPIHLPLSEIQSVINAKIPNSLVKNKEVKAGIKISVSRGGKLTLDGEKRTLKWSVPLVVTVSHKLIGTITRFKIMPVFHSQLEAKEDYSLTSKSALDQVIWMNKAMVQVLGVEMDISPHVDKLIHDESERITSLIDHHLGKLDIKKVLTKTWTKLTNPIRVNRKVQPVYVLVDPKQITLRDYGFKNHNLALDLSVNGGITTVYDSIRNIVDTLVFPPLVIDESKQSETELYLPIIIEYDRINNILRENVFGAEFKVEDRNIVIDSLNLTSVDSFMLISASVSGDMSADIEVLGRPSFSPSTRMLSVNGFDFTVNNTSESLLAAGDYFFHDEIIAEVLTKLNIPIGSLIDSIPELIYRGIERGKSGKNIEVNANLDSIAFDQFRIRYDDMRMVVFASGNLDLRVEHLKKQEQPSVLLN